MKKSPRSSEGEVIKESKRSGILRMISKRIKRLTHSKEDDYKLASAVPIGKGAFGEVFLVRDKDGNMRALKKIRVANKDEKRAAMNEAQLLYNLDHPNLLKVFNFYEHSSWVPFSDKVIGIVSEYCDQGCLSRVLGRGEILSEKDIILVLLQVADGLAYLHEQNIMHRDIKLENILVKTNSEESTGGITRQQLKLADLGLATLLQDDGGKLRETHTIAGTQPYMAPEVITNKAYTFSADIYSLGCVLAELILWRRCWKVGDLRNAVRASTRVSSGLRDLCLWMLNDDADVRPDIYRVMDALRELQRTRVKLPVLPPAVIKANDAVKYAFLVGFGIVLVLFSVLLYHIRQYLAL